MDDDLPPGTAPDAEGDLVLHQPDPAPDPSQIRDPLPQPLFSLRRVVIVLVLAVAVGALVVAARAGGDTSGQANDQAIVAYDPRPGGQVARQAPVGVELQQGYDGRLTINGVAIPEDQMVGAIEPGSEAEANLSPEQRELGPRPNNKNLVKFQPGPGKAVTEYDTGTVEVTVEFWRVSEGREDARTVSYAIRVF